VDPIADIIGLLKPEAYKLRGLDAAGAWSIVFGAGSGIRCFGITRGTCQLAISGMASPLDLGAGTFVLLLQGQACHLYTSRDIEPVAAPDVFSSQAGQMAVLNGGGCFAAVGGYFTMVPAYAELLFQALPAVLHVNRANDRATLDWMLNRLMQELATRLPGSGLSATFLAQGLLVQALRLCLANGSLNLSGCLVGAGDQYVGAALSAIHADPGRRWSIEALSEVSGLSRSAFASRFKEIMGEPVLSYLTRWRMLLAADRITSGPAALAVLAPSLGYASQSAFSTAFKRQLGCSPRQFASKLPRR